MSRDTCRYPSCDEPARGSDAAMDASGASFCSARCEVAYNHLRADARDAARDAREEARR